MSNKKTKNKLGDLISKEMEKENKKRSIVPTLAEISKMVREGNKIIEDERAEKIKYLETATTEQIFRKAYSVTYEKLSTEEKKIVDAKTESRTLTEFTKRVIVLTEEMETELEKNNKK